jgi:hypothetical protein
MANQERPAMPKFLVGTNEESCARGLSARGIDVAAFLQQGYEWI